MSRRSYTPRRRAVDLALTMLGQVAFVLACCITTYRRTRTRSK